MITINLPCFQLQDFLTQEKNDEESFFSPFSLFELEIAYFPFGCCSCNVALLIFKILFALNFQLLLYVSSISLSHSILLNFTRRLYLSHFNN